ncbi:MULTISPECIES: PilZ domain-containing protein [Lysinibacillus]|uniref:PilZ domain-containing protein n=1 Tax=Lysinibacillus pakistanensis TaxID=759811 RepID=A0AAX3WXG8_9BACI|nr:MULTISPECIES: PilZ domain-containing protein [Lysinibacillus]MDM5231848.1 PilZ domain-containing protein [Lysinibacillus pakistanensis]QGG50068.1 PilZ domain-containing protein [Lysinibacillus pakistanensis]WHY47386.1 PilZ domain-containing protein [Lysinibacillus pakistanensis]WHY52395.1 PilZ domain-containing protein [Lysinibacillus pakistanensis]
MIFKRQEGFRFKFEEPVTMTFAIYEDGRVNQEQTAMAELLDISPRGLKMFTEVDLGVNPPPLDLRFVLDTREVRAYGEIIWSRPFGTGKQYGVFFNNQGAVEDLIVEELKLRRKKEAAEAKIKNNS